MAVIIQDIIVPEIAQSIIEPIFSKKYLFLIVKADSNIIGGKKAIRNI